MWRDAVVIGGGPSGSTVALLLARAGWSVAIIEQDEFPRRKVCGEFLSATNLPLLRELGLLDDFLNLAGPPVTRIGLFAGNRAVTADMPRIDTEVDAWGSALGREYLDTALLDRAAAAGATVLQPYTAVDVHRAPGEFTCTIARARSPSGVLRLRTPTIIAAHGSWYGGSLPTQPTRTPARRSDLFGFKARFSRSRLPPGLMPLLSFPGGYGGMVHTDHDFVSLSCCVRRDQLERCRRLYKGVSASAAVLRHVMHNCEGVRDALDGASLEPESWRSTGPIRPGIRGTRFESGIFLIGNAAGEAHPVVAEGISMAIQSAWLLARSLTSGRAADFDRDWRRAFTWRIRAASVIAHWAMRPVAVSLTLPLLRAFPLVLTGGAKTTGKVSVLCSPSS